MYDFLSNHLGVPVLNNSMCVFFAFFLDECYNSIAQFGYCHRDDVCRLSVWLTMTHDKSTETRKMFNVKNHAYRLKSIINVNVKFLSMYQSIAVCSLPSSLGDATGAGCVFSACHGLALSALRSIFNCRACTQVSSNFFFTASHSSVFFCSSCSAWLQFLDIWVRSRLDSCWSVQNRFESWLVWANCVL